MATGAVQISQNFISTTRLYTLESKYKIMKPRTKDCKKVYLLWKEKLWFSVFSHLRQPSFVQGLINNSRERAGREMIIPGTVFSRFLLNVSFMQSVQRHSFHLPLYSNIPLILWYSYSCSILCPFSFCSACWHGYASVGLLPPFKPYSPLYISSHRL